MTINLGVGDPKAQSPEPGAYLPVGLPDALANFT
jgi:hypothetical protein